MDRKYYQHGGFTLIELSIVLVIIGLIVGGILVGQNLIAAAGVRATITQMEKYQTAVNTFRGKFSALPGDISSADAATFGFTARSGATGHGDGNGVLEGCAAGATVAGCETVLFWNDLSTAGLIPGQFSTATDAVVRSAFLDTMDTLYAFVQDTLEAFNPISEAYAACCGPPTYAKNLIFPASSSINGNTSVTVFSTGGTNYYQLAGITSTDSSGVYTLTNTLTPLQAYAIDNKVDDGYPLAGTLQAMEGTGPLNTAAVAGAATCVYNVGAPSPYNIATAVNSTPLCQLRFEFQ